MKCTCAEGLTERGSHSTSSIAACGVHGIKPQQDDVLKGLIEQVARLKDANERMRIFIGDLSLHPSCPKCGSQKLTCQYGHTWYIQT